jgi:hypothetical protein
VKKYFWGILLVALGFWIAASALSDQDSVPVVLSPPIVIVKTPEPTVSPTPSVHSLEKAGAELLKDRAWLTDLYSWTKTFDLENEEVEANKTGAYCIGNGRAFALIGLSAPLWNWSNLYGASYQSPELGGLRMEITRGGQATLTPKQKIGWLRRSGVVKVRAEGKGLTVESYDFAPVTASEESSWNNPPVLVRLVHILNTGDRVESDLDVELKVQPTWNSRLAQKADGRDLMLDQPPNRPKKRTIWRLAAFNNKSARVWDDALHYSVPTLQPGGETWAAFFLLAADSTSENRSQAEELRKRNPLALLDQTHAYYEDWFAKGTTFSGDAKVADLFEIESLIFKSQQAHSGGFSPLIGYSYTWIRDNNGPIRWFLKTGHTREARRAMDFFYGVASTSGALLNSVKVDYALDYHRKDLSKIHVEHSETPNWIVLQHWWYYQTTGDIELVRARWNYLKRCVEGQMNVDDKYFFHRDETYLWCLEGRIFNHVPFPNYYLSTFAFSTDSSFELVAAADYLAYLGKYLEMDKDVSSLKKLSERVRAKTEETYWNEKLGYWAPAQSLLGPIYNSPFANILLNPLWCGYARNDLDPLGETPKASAKAVRAYKSAYPFLGREDGFWKTTPTVDFFVGMNPGQLLYGFCKARLPWASTVYPAVLKTASPSGDFSEMYDGKYQPWNPPALGKGTSGRVRPWEGGLNTESLLEYLTGFSPDAGNGRVVFAPHLPENQQAFEAQNLFVGPTKVSFFLKRLGSKKWMVTLRLNRGEQLSVTMDFWASRRIFTDIETDGKVTWDKTLVESSGRQGRCNLTLEAEKDFSFTVKEGGLLPKDELEPPKPADFQPEPYDVSRGDLLLLTSPSAILNQRKYKFVEPENFIASGKTELSLMGRVTRSLEFLDLDLPISSDDIARGLLDEKGNTKFKVAVFGRGAFSSGKHHFKPVSYWEDPRFAKAVKKFLNKGGCLFFGPSFPNREVLPDWFISMTGGGWEEGTLTDKAVLAEPGKIQASQKLVDEVDVANEGSETGHAVTFTGEILEDTQNLPDGLNEKKMIQDNGRVFSGYYEFAVKTVPGIKHRLWLRVNTGRNIKGMALQIFREGQWAQVGVRTQNDGATRHFQALYFDIPEKWVTAEKTIFRLISKTEPEVNAYHLWIYKVEGGKSQSLPELLGFVSNRDAGEVNHGLIPKGKEWKVPFILSQHPDQGAVLIQKIGKGYLIRSELTLENSIGMLKSLLNQETLDQMEQSW